MSDYPPGAPHSPPPPPQAFRDRRPETLAGRPLQYGAGLPNGPRQPAHQLRHVGQTGPGALRQAYQEPNKHTYPDYSNQRYAEGYGHGANGYQGQVHAYNVRGAYAYPDNYHQEQQRYGGYRPEQEADVYYRREDDYFRRGNSYQHGGHPREHERGDYAGRQEARAPPNGYRPDYEQDRTTARNVPLSHMEGRQQLRRPTNAYRHPNADIYGAVRATTRTRPPRDPPRPYRRPQPQRPRIRHAGPRLAQSLQPARTQLEVMARLGNSDVFVRDDSGYMVMAGRKRKHCDEEEDSEVKTKEHRAKIRSILDISVPDTHPQNLDETAMNEEIKATRAYQAQIIAQIGPSHFEGPERIKTREESEATGETGDIILSPVVEFRANLTEPDEEVFDWMPVPEGIIIVKFRAQLLAANEAGGLRTKPFTAFGDSDPSNIIVYDKVRGRRYKLNDYLQMQRLQGEEVPANPMCYRPPLYFRGWSYPFTKSESFINVFQEYIHPHTVPWKIIGRLEGLKDYEAWHEIETAVARNRVSPSAVKLEEMRRQLGPRQTQQTTVVTPLAATMDPSTLSTRTTEQAVAPRGLDNTPDLTDDDDSEADTQDEEHSPEFDDDDEDEHDEAYQSLRAFQSQKKLTQESTGAASPSKRLGKTTIARQALEAIDVNKEENKAVHEYGADDSRT